MGQFPRSGLTYSASTSRVVIPNGSMHFGKEVGLAFLIIGSGAGGIFRYPPPISRSEAGSMVRLGLVYIFI